MNRRTVILWGLGAGQLLSAAIALALMETSSGGWIDTFLAAIMYGQFYLAGVWIAAGQRSIRWRLVAVAVCLTSLTWCPREAVPVVQQAIAYLGPGIVMALLPLLLARALGRRFYELGSATPSSNVPRFQFTLRSILESTAAVAVLFSLASLVHPGVIAAWTGIGLKEATFLLLIHLTFAAICLGEMIAIMATQRPWLGIALFLPAGIAIGGCFGWMMEDVAEILSLVVCLMLWFAIAFVPLRLLGYRFGRCRTIDKPLLQSPSQEDSAVD